MLTWLLWPACVLLAFYAVLLIWSLIGILSEEVLRWLSSMPKDTQTQPTATQEEKMPYWPEERCWKIHVDTYTIWLDAVSDEDASEQFAAIAIYQGRVWQNAWARQYWMSVLDIGDAEQEWQSVHGRN